MVGTMVISVLQISEWRREPNELPKFIQQVCGRAKI